MIKGINKRIVEVNITDSDYFEKAVLYMKPERCSEGKAAAEEAKQYAELITAVLEPDDARESKQKRRRREAYLFLLLAAAAAVTAGLWLLIMYVQ